MVAELSDNNDELPFEWPADIIHCDSGRQYIIGELVREYFKDQVKIAKKRDPSNPHYDIETVTDSHVDIINKEDATYDRCCLLVNYSRSGKPNKIDIIYDEVDQPWVSRGRKTRTRSSSKGVLSSE